MRLFNSKNLGIAALAMGMFSASHFAHAFQPGGISWKITDWSNSEGVVKPGQTPGGESVLYANLQFYLDKEDPKPLPLLVLMSSCGQDSEIGGKPVLNLENLLTGRSKSPVYNSDWINPGPAWRLCPKVDALVINDATSNVILPLEVDFLRAVDGGMSPHANLDVYEISEEDWKLQLTPEELARKYRNQTPNSRVPVSADYFISKGLFKLTNYAGAYGNAVPEFNPKLSLPRGVKKTGAYSNVASFMPVNIESFRRKLKIPTSTEFNKAFDINLVAELGKKQGSAKEGKQICYPETTTTQLSPIGLAPVAPLTVKGRFSTKWTTDHSLHSAFGFLVEVWSRAPNPIVKLGSGWVQANGSWNISVPSVPAGFDGSIRINYLSYNNYYAPQNQAGNKYWWSDAWTMTASTFDTGHRWVDTDGGTYNGLGELVNSAMTMWSRLYWDAGIDPVASAPIKFFFPNTWYDCGDGSNSPWSCATFEGDQIWLIASHGVQGDVVNHEMGHALQAKFWNGNRADGSGGSHSLNGCYPNRLGLALGEGFANFMGAWVGYPERNQADGSFGSGIWALNFDPEQRTAPPNCANGWENETWVARTFWDLHDTHADGDDILWFNHKGAVISLFLSNGLTSNGPRDMTFYRNIYKGAASTGHQTYVNDIFNQNRQ